MVDPDETAAGVGGPDSPEQWGDGGMIGDGRYRLTHRLGRGGMAEVFAAEDVRLGRVVAVKLLRSDLAEDPVSKARFTREAQSVAGLNHHAVVAVYDSGEDRGTGGTVPYIVMELVEGHTIRDLLLGSEAPPVDQALIIVSGVLDALAYSHRHGIVHRDIKPANVIITNTGAVKVMDFGIARALHGASNTMTQTGMVMGTPQYLSPEQALGKTVDHRSDLYATGCLLYELLALRPPFTGETPLSVVYQHVQDEPQVPSEANRRVPPELDGLVLRALAKHPDDRFQSAEEMHGVVQYALRMLHERGAYTGSWDTGFVPQGPAATPARGTGGIPHPNHHATAQMSQPLLPQRPGGDDIHGYDQPPYDDDGRGGGSWLKPVLFVLAAVLAVSLGVYIATAGTGKGGGGADRTNPPASQSATDQQPTPSTEQPSTGSSDDTSGGYTGTPSETPTQHRTRKPTESATPSPTDTATETPTDSPTDTPTEAPSHTPSGTPGTGTPTPGGLG